MHALYAQKYFVFAPDESMMSALHLNISFTFCREAAQVCPVVAVVATLLPVVGKVAQQICHLQDSEEAVRILPQRQSVVVEQVHRNSKVAMTINHVYWLYVDL